MIFRYRVRGNPVNSKQEAEFKKEQDRPRIPLGPPNP
jgi:hypothetical protein